MVQEDYPGYVKVVVDVEKKVLAAGGQWHADAEKVLLGLGSKQENLWGGAMDLETGEVNYVSLINLRPGISQSMEVIDVDVRDVMREVIYRVFKE